jgi:hypothetical protein
MVLPEATVERSMRLIARLESVKDIAELSAVVSR